MINPEYFFGFTILIFSLAGAIAYIAMNMHSGHRSDDPPTVRLEVRRLYFVGGAISALGLVFLEGMGMYYFSCPSTGCAVGAEVPGKKIFEACVQVIPPLITLILGYYFGKTTARSKLGSNRATTDNCTVPPPNNVA